MAGALAAIPAIVGMVGAAAPAAGAGAGAAGVGLMDLGLGSGAGMTLGSEGLGSMGEALAPSLGGEAMAASTGGGLMTMDKMMGPDYQGADKLLANMNTPGNKNMQELDPMVQAFMKQGMQAPDMSQPSNPMMGLMNMLGGQ